MASIEKRPTKNGGFKYQVNLRRGNLSIYKTFHTEEDAKLYAFYKERLIDNMANFEVPMNEMITFRQIMEVKKNSIPKESIRELNDFDNSTKRFALFLNIDELYFKINLEDWIECAKKLLNMDVYKGGKTEAGKRKMSPSTLRKVFAHGSSAVSYIISQGIPLDNMPLKVIQSYIRTLEKRDEEEIEITPSSGNVFVDLEIENPEEELKKAQLGWQ